MRIAHPLPAAYRLAAAELYWTAFGTKLGRVMGPGARAVGFFRDTLRAENALAAIGDDGALLGIVAFRTAGGGFADISYRDLRASYGRPGAAWRSMVFRIISRQTARGIGPGGFTVEGLCVAPGARGRGVGTELLAAAAGLARERGFAEVRLEVTDTNLRARDLYLRLGFVPRATERVGALRYLFGFDATIAMARPVDDWPAPPRAL